MNFHNDEYINARVAEHYEEVLYIFPPEEVLGVFAYGSMNYGLDTEESDVDTVCLLVPSFDELAFGNKLYSQTYERTNGEHIDFKDVRLFTENVRKMGHTYLEILFTDYFIINPLYKEAWDKVVAMREDIAHYDPEALYRYWTYDIKKKASNIDRRNPAREEIVNKFGYDPKQLHHIERLINIMNGYKAGLSYKICLSLGFIIEEEIDFLKDLKTGKIFFSSTTAKELANNFSESAEAALKNFSMAPTPNAFLIDKILDNFRRNCVKICVQEYLDYEAEEQYIEDEYFGKQMDNKPIRKIYGGNPIE